MKNLAKTTLLALTLSTGMALADHTTASKLDINKVLPRTITVTETPLSLRIRKNTPTMYSPLQKAKIVGLELKSIRN